MSGIAAIAFGVLHSSGLD